MIYKIEFKEQANKDLVALARYEPKAFLKMNNYTFDVKLKDGEIIRDTVCAPSRLVGESIILEMYSAVSINLVSVN